MTDDGSEFDEVEWNNDPEWLEYIQGFEPVIKGIARNRTQDVGLREDCAQEARMALLTIRPEKVAAWESFQRGKISKEKWEKELSKYCRQVIHYSILSYLTSYKTGNWYVSRRNRNSDEMKMSRYTRLSTLLDFGAQVDEEGNLLFGEEIEDVSLTGSNVTLTGHALLRDPSDYEY